MKKISLNQKILSIQGEPVEGEFKNSKTGKVEKRYITIRDSLMVILGARFEVIEPKEAFWTTEIGIKVADSKNEYLELSNDKMDFLKRIIEKNQVKRLTQAGEQNITLYPPFEHGQLLALFEKK